MAAELRGQIPEDVDSRTAQRLVGSPESDASASTGSWAETQHVRIILKGDTQRRKRCDSAFW